MLTEREAWLRVASEMRVLVYRKPSICTRGICAAMFGLWHGCIIDEETFVAMEKRMKDAPEYANVAHYYAAYWWPRTRKGYRDRVAFCRRMAAECEEGAKGEPQHVH